MLQPKKVAPRRKQKFSDGDSSVPAEASRVTQQDDIIEPGAAAGHCYAQDMGKIPSHSDFIPVIQGCQLSD